MSYQQTVLRTWNENVLFTTLVELTYRCNLDCFFCYNDRALSGKPMRLADYERFFEDLASLSCLHLTLSGGEPLAHPDFFAIGSRARALGFLVRVKSNAHSLRGEILRRLQTEVDPFVVEVSLHGGRAETHDRQTRVPGSFLRFLANLEEMRAAGLRFKINSTLTRWNESEIEEMFAIADRFDAPLALHPDVSPRDDGDRTPLEISPTAEGLRKLYRVVAERSAQTSKASKASKTSGEVVREGDAQLPSLDAKKYCGAGSSGIAVDPYGNVYPCVQWRRPVGNLHDRSIVEIWTGNARLDAIRGLTGEVREKIASMGSFGKLLNFCPGAAEAATGSPFEVPEPMASRASVFAKLSDEKLLPLHPGG